MHCCGAPRDEVRAFPFHQTASHMGLRQAHEAFHTPGNDAASGSPWPSLPSFHR